MGGPFTLLMSVEGGGVDAAMFCLFSSSPCWCWGGALGQRHQRGAHIFLGRARCKSNVVAGGNALFPLLCLKTRDLVAARAAWGTVTLSYSAYVVHIVLCVYG